MSELIFIHIPKTGGLSFMQTLNKVYGGELCEIWNYLPGQKADVLAENNSEFFTHHANFRMRAAMGLRGAHNRVLCGHIPVWVIKDSFDNGTPIVTWLRNPVDLVISRIFHFRKEGFIGTRKMTPLEIAELPVFRNLQFFYTGGNLTQFRHFGILEHYEEDLASMGHHLGWSEVKPIHIHRTNYEEEMRAEVSQDQNFRARLRDLNSWDMMLYDQALETSGWR